MIALLDSPKVDVAAVADALEGLRALGATGQAYLQADGHEVCVNAVNGGEETWPEYSVALSRRAVTRGRRLLPVLDGGEIDGRLWIAYDMGSTTSLPRYRGQHPLPTATSIRVLSDVARALDEAAGVGLFPSELPPDSVFVSRRGARLGDLGTAREAFAGAAFELESDSAFVPPEVLHGERPGERSGVYLFGALLYHLITGGSPPRGPSTPLGRARPDLPVSIKSIVGTVMADDPGSRPASAGEAYDMAKRALRGEPPARTGGGRSRGRAARQGVALKRAGAPKQNAATPTQTAAAAPRRTAASEPNVTAPKPSAAAPKRKATASKSTRPPKPARAPKPKATAPHPTSAPKSASTANATAPRPEPVAPTPGPEAKRNSANGDKPAKSSKPAAAPKRRWSRLRTPESPGSSAAAKPVSEPAPRKVATGKAAEAPKSSSWQWPSRPGRRRAVAKPAAAQAAGSGPAATNKDTRQPVARKVAGEAPNRRKPATRKPSAQAVGAKLAGVVTGVAASVGASLSHRKPSILRPQRRRPNVAVAPGRRFSTSEVPPRRRLRAVAVGGALLLGTTAGLLLGRSPDPEPARAQSVTTDGLSVILPSGWHPIDSDADGLSAQAESGVILHARLVDRPLELQEDYKAVRLGAFEVWHHAGPGAGLYTTPTSAGTLVITCRASGGSAPLRECERAASTLRLRGARTLPLTAALEDSERLRAAVAALEAQRDRARTRLGRAKTARGQRLHAQDLARIHSRAATALDGLAKAASITAAVRRAADAYSRLAASAESGSAERWERASERVRRNEAALAKAIANVV